jgi:hypothetical protein
VKNGDLDLVEGLENMTQAIRHRFSTEPGELPTHPTYGFAYPTGTKAKILTLTQFKMGGRASLLRDSRVADIPKLDLYVDGNTLHVTANIALVGVDSPVGLDFDVRR